MSEQRKRLKRCDQKVRGRYVGWLFLRRGQQSRRRQGETFTIL